jgi:hypothetical protein
MAASFDPRIAALALSLVACSPALDWREVRADGGSLTALFPCRPEHRARAVPLAAGTVRMEMAACAAGGSTYALAYVDVADPAAVGAVLEALRRTAASNVGAGAPSVAPFAFPGTTPNPSAARLKVDGRLPDGTEVHEHAAFFVRGLRVYQASVIGAEPSAEGVETFIGGLKLPR